MAPVDAYIGLGANLGDARAAVMAAMQAIAGVDGVALLRCSSLYGSAPVAAGGPDFVNAVVAVASTLSAVDLLRALHQIEDCAGRQRPYLNAPRTLDLDLLLFGDLVVQSNALVLPHPRMGQRAFVLRPLAEIAPERVSPAQLQAVQTQSVWLL